MRALPAAALDAVGSGPFTLEAWIRNTNSTTAIWKRVITKRGAANAWWSLALNGGVVRMELYDGAGGAQDVDGSRIVADGAWHHIAGVRGQNPDQIRIYVDGALDVATRNLVGDLRNREILEIGLWSTEAYDEGSFRGQIDEVRVSNVARYAADFTPPATFAPDAQTVALYHFDGSGSFAIDSSGAGNTGALVGGATLAASSAPVGNVTPYGSLTCCGSGAAVNLATSNASCGTCGKSCGAGQRCCGGGCDAGTSAALFAYGDAKTQSYATVPNAPALNCDAGASAITVEAWIEPISFTAQGWAGYPNRVMIMNKELVYEMALFNGILSGYVVGAGNWVSGGPVLPLDRWSHVALSSDGATMRLFLNGTPVASQPLTNPGPMSTTTPLIIGWRSNAAEAPFSGLIDEVRISSSARYTAPFVAPLAPFVSDAQTAGLWHFDEDPGATRFADVSGNANDAYAQGGATTARASCCGDSDCDVGRCNFGRCSSCAAVGGAISAFAAEGNTNDSIASNNGIIFGNTTYDAGVIGQAFLFPDTDSGVQAPTAGFPTGAADRTLELWVRLDAAPPSGEAFFAGYGAFGQGSQTFQLGSFGTQLFFSQWGGAITGPALAIGQWYHVAATAASGVVTLYLDGSAVASGAMPLNTPSGSSLVIGRIPGALGDQRKLIGAVDEVTIYGRALSAAELQAIAAAGGAGKCR